MKKPITLLDDQGVKKLSLPEGLSSHINTLAYLYLQPNGWFHDHPKDEDGITPWYTFPAISFIKDIISVNTKVFEYGSGFSTLFYNTNAGQTISVEHDPVWYSKIKEQLPGAHITLVEQNAEVHPEADILVTEFRKNFLQVRSDNLQHDLTHGLVNDEFAGYASALYNYPKGHFDIVVLDGMARSLCGVLAAERLNDDGIIILDNSDRWHYNELQKHLINKGYKRIDFWGPGFNNHKAWCTSIYAKNLSFKNNKLERPIVEGEIFI
jgi:hypothetical protein